MDVRIASGYRSFARQQQIWNAKALGQRAVYDLQGEQLDILQLPPAQRVSAILNWSALPGTSRHHWGSDIDIFDAAAMPDGYTVQLSRTEADTVFAELHRWLEQRIAAGQSHGFYRPYQGRGKVAPEPWHLSHRPVAGLCAARFSRQLLRATLVAGELQLREHVLSAFDDIIAGYVEPYL